MAESLAEMRRIDLDQLLRAKSALEATFAAVPDAVLMIDPRERVTSMNESARALFESVWSPDSFLDSLPLPLAALNAVRQALTGHMPPRPGANLASALTYKTSDRTLRLLPVATPVPHFEGEAHGAVLVLYDVTDFAKLDELRMELIAVASHELKTPLTTLNMNLLLMRESIASLSERNRELLVNALQATDELSKTIDELLDLTRADSGQLRLSLDRVDLQVLAEQTAQRLQPRFDESGIALKVLSAGSSTICRGDTARLGMVLTNVLANALKYTPRGGRVCVSLSCNGADGLGVRLAVTDTGPGIPIEFRERVFEKFFRVEHHRSDSDKQPRGTGIGLYLCKHIVQAHGGSIWCEAGENGGTTIAFALACEPVQGQPSHSIHANGG